MAPTDGGESDTRLRPRRDRGDAFRAVVRLVAPERRLGAVACGLAVATAALEGASAALALPLFQALGGAQSSLARIPGVAGRVLAAVDTWPAKQRVAAFCVVLVGLTIAKNLGRYFTDLSTNTLQLRVGRRLRLACVDRLVREKWAFHTRATPGELLSLVNEQTQRVETLLSYAVEGAADLLVVAVLGGLLIALAPGLTVVTGLGLAAGVLGFRTLTQSVQVQGRRAADAIQGFGARVGELLAGIRVIKEHGTEAREYERAERVADERYAAELAAYRRRSAVVPVTESIGVATLLTIVAASALIPARGPNLPLLLTYVLALVRVLPRLSHLNAMRAQFAMYAGSLEKVGRFLAEAPPPGPTSPGRQYTRLRQGIRFEGVGFRYPGAGGLALEAVNLELPRCTRTAVVGPSGAGKSTLADLLIRFYPPTTGRITFDGVDAQEIDLASLRRAVAIVSQDTFLFNTSVRENVAYARPEASWSEIRAAAVRAHALQFIEQLPKGWDTILGNRGSLLSGGERQRIAIARAVLQDPDVLVLDEATSALDVESERFVHSALEELCRNRTVLVIAHRLSTVRGADRIVVLERGRVIESGTHDQLVRLDGRYRELAELASGTGELR